MSGARYVLAKLLWVLFCFGFFDPFGCFCWHCHWLFWGFMAHRSWCVSALPYRLLRFCGCCSISVVWIVRGILWSINIRCRLKNCDMGICRFFRKIIWLGFWLRWFVGLSCVPWIVLRWFGDEWNWICHWWFFCCICYRYAIKPISGRRCNL